MGRTSRDLPRLERLAARLAATLPRDQPSSLVHVHNRLNSSCLTGRQRHGGGWEMATQGDPLTDLASMVAWWDGLSGLDSPVTCPDSRGARRRYAASSGWASPGCGGTSGSSSSDGWHCRRYPIPAPAGLTVGEGFELLGGLVPDQVQLGDQALDKA